ncbi:MAG: S-methyl-5'-thioinosine phosphorylase [Pseudomonadota bacterium]|nr:S-methyl-5'-thioinosine phosphorylase [Pseudomonadota bacterium]
MSEEIQTAVIGGSGLTELKGLQVVAKREAATPYGTPSAPLYIGDFHGHPVVFLARHGVRHSLPPHQVNYQANLWALHSVGVKQVFAVAAVGGIHSDLGPGQLAVPDQLIDYTWGRAHSFSDVDDVSHIDFTHPYTPKLRDRLLLAAKQAGVEVLEHGTYGVTQGPRLETAAEVRRLRRDGCDMVGMTAMPEAALARELEVDYASLAVSVNWAAGAGPQGSDIHAEIEETLSEGMAKARAILAQALKLATHLE